MQVNHNEAWIIHKAEKWIHTCAGCLTICHPGAPPKPLWTSPQRHCADVRPLAFSWSLEPFEPSLELSLLQRTMVNGEEKLNIMLIGSDFWEKKKNPFHICHILLRVALMFTGMQIVHEYRFKTRFTREDSCYEWKFEATCIAILRSQQMCHCHSNPKGTYSMFYFWGLMNSLIVLYCREPQHGESCLPSWHVRNLNIEVHCCWCSNFFSFFF